MLRLPTPVFMADIARAMSTLPPAQQSQATPQPTQPPPQPDLKQGFQKANAADVKRAEKNERDRLRRKAQRAAALKAAETPKKKTASKRKKKKTVRVHALTNAAVAPTKKKRRRGRPPGAKNKPKVGLAVALVPAPGVLPRGRVTAALLADNSLLARIQQAVALLNAMPEHARKVVLDAVK